jgi:hypothetical protein
MIDYLLLLGNWAGHAWSLTPRGMAAGQDMLGRAGR